MSIVKENGKYGYLSLDGKEIAPVYQEARYFEDGLAPVREKGKWGVIDTAGNMVVQPSYKDAGPIYSEGLLAVKNGKDLWGFIDKTGSEAVEPAYKEVIPVFTEGYTAVENNDKLWGFINTKVKSPQSLSSKQFLPNFLKAWPVSRRRMATDMPDPMEISPSWPTITSFILLKTELQK